jgi:hypothetical protein
LPTPTVISRWAWWRIRVLTLPQELIAYALAHPDSPLASNLAHNPNLPQAQEPVTFAIAIAVPDSDVALGVAQNPKLSSIAEVVMATVANPDSGLASAVARNPRLYTWEF